MIKQEGKIRKSLFFSKYVLNLLHITYRRAVPGPFPVLKI